MSNGDAEKTLANGNRSSGSNLDDSFPSRAQEMTVIDRSNNNKPGSDPSVPSDLSTLSSCHTPSQDSDGTSNKRILSGKSAPSPNQLETSIYKTGMLDL